ncbi:NC domain-containing protein [Rhynchospora pubera]|uniref:NC domain-containing protein n=1 Tax=Rhynchospora pubera TaxID=906938 RepID=A0AAV8HNS8_9POAL|nr:NC domain-containing protein [Rhynchospora pubera]
MFIKPGDHIYSWRSIIYSHHGIYVGDHKVIHFTSSGGSSTTSSSPHTIVCSACQHCADALHQLPTHQTQAPSQVGVIISCLDTFLNGGGLCRYAYSLSAEDFLVQARGGTGTTAHSDPPNDVLHRARFLLKANDFGTYSLFKNNCEDFAIYCKTSLVKKRTTISCSGQIKTLIASIFGGGNIVGAGFSGMAVGSILGGSGIPTPINLRSHYLSTSISLTLALIEISSRSQSKGLLSTSALKNIHFSTQEGNFYTHSSSTL